MAERMISCWGVFAALEPSRCPQASDLIFEGMRLNSDATVGECGLFSGSGKRYWLFLVCFSSTLFLFLSHSYQIDSFRAAVRVVLRPVPEQPPPTLRGSAAPVRGPARPAFRCVRSKCELIYFLTLKLGKCWGAAPEYLPVFRLD